MKQQTAVYIVLFLLGKFIILECSEDYEDGVVVRAGDTDRECPSGMKCVYKDYCKYFSVDLESQSNKIRSQKARALKKN